MDWYHDEWGVTVILVQTLQSGDQLRRKMMPLGAAIEALVGNENGVTVASCHIEFKYLLDGYGSSA